MPLKTCLAAALSLLLLACGGGGNNGGGNGSNSVPNPTRLTITETGVDEITLTWTPPGGSFDGYELEGKVGSDAFQKLHDGLIPNTYTSLILTFYSTAPEDTYGFRLRAARGGAFSPYSNEASYTRGPNAPGQPTASFDWTTGSVSLAWNRNTTMSDGLRIERAECTQYGYVTGTWTSLPTPAPLASTYSDTGATPNLYYTYRITNLKGSRASQPSAQSQAVYTGLAAVSWINAAYDTGQAGVVVSWGSNTTVAADGVRLERSDSDASGNSQGNWAVVTMPAGYRSSFLDQNVVEGGRYFYRVANLYGTTATTPCMMYYSVLVPMLAPTGLQAVSTQGGIQLTWQNRSTTANQVVIRRNPSLGTTSDIAILSPGTTAYLDVPTSLGYYTYTVVAKNGTQEASGDSVKAATLNPPSALALSTTTLNLPSAADAALRPAGSWAFATASPFGVLSNNDPWTANFPGGAGRGADPIIQVDRQGWPHAVYATAVSYGASTSLVHLWYDGTLWKSETMASAVVPSTSANMGWTYRLDSAGNPHLLLDHVTANQPYGGATASLSYVHKVNGAWVEESLAGLSPVVFNIGTFHLTLDDSDIPHVLLGNWSSVIDYVRTGPGAWTSTTIPTVSAAAGWYDFVDSLWIDGNNGWVFYHSYAGFGDALNVVQMKNGTWLPSQALEPKALSNSANSGRCAFSPDRSRVAILAPTSLGFKVFHQAADGWQETLVADPSAGWAWVMRLGFDANQKAHILLSAGNGYTDSHE
jgi:hypothetical protein